MTRVAPEAPTIFLHQSITDIQNITDIAVLKIVAAGIQFIRANQLINFFGMI